MASVPSSKLRIGIVSPARLGSNQGNSVTAERYAKIFRSLGMCPRIINAVEGHDFDMLVALHARKSGRSALAFRKSFPERPLIVVLTGTDVYRDIRTSRLAQRVMRAASALVVLQHLAIGELPRDVRRKTRPVIQSATPIRGRRGKQARFEVCVLGHLRWEKDPLRTAYALRVMPTDLPIRVTQAGAALTPRFAQLARREERKNQRYRWVGDLNRAAARRLLASSDLMVISSRMEGGANVVSEAIASGIPIIASKVPGNRGVLGPDHPGYYDLSDTGALATLLERALCEPICYGKLKRASLRLRSSVSLKGEQKAWQKLILELLNRD